MLRRIACAGAPRDAGLDQGRACRGELASRIAQRSRPARVLSWLRGPADARLAGLRRDLTRHFPHLAERTNGLARGAGIPIESLLVALDRELRTADRAVGLGLVQEPGGAPRLVIQPAPGWLLRACEPDGGFRSLVLTAPWFAGAFAGVNERGLAAVGATLAAPGPDEAVQAPAILLLEQCLERFDEVGKALEWCERRPGGGRARLLFAQGDGGEVGAVELDAGKRHRLEPVSLAPDGSRSGGGEARVDPAARALEVATPGGDRELHTL